MSIIVSVRTRSFDIHVVTAYKSQRLTGPGTHHVQNPLTPYRIEDIPLFLFLIKMNEIKSYLFRKSKEVMEI